jgi:hypothetical protein
MGIGDTPKSLKLPVRITQEDSDIAQLVFGAEAALAEGRLDDASVFVEQIYHWFDQRQAGTATRSSTKH